MSDTPKDAKGIFLAALEIGDVAERAAFIARACEGDEPLRRRVEDLLTAYGKSDGAMEKLADALAPTHLGEPLREQVGATIGPYKLMEQIGEGGFGLVFVAEQERPIRRKVAVKIIKPGMDTRDVIARFEAERQALALMDHPNIARVLDAGTTESGRPYFVMELVRGIAITDYCDKNQLTPRERLELFIPVCNAIQHAHLKGIIHRDIKPSNVLVTMHDGKPVVKVIDFGVAKALHQPLTDRTVYTRFAQLLGTPLYMSPEQAEMSGLDIDTRTDVYSLGVLLYELLTGTTPLDKKRLAKAAYDELLKIIREDDPPKPSLRLSQASDSLPSIAALRKTEPAKLSKMFHGDVDLIAMKALEKDRTRRYETANAFAADVLRYLNDEPVEACPPSTVYRLRKFARKHRKPVIALAAIAAALVLGIAGTTWGLFRATRAERMLTESLRAETQAHRDAAAAKLRAEELAARERAEREAATKAREQAFAALKSMTADVVERKFAQGAVLTEDDRAFLRGIIAQYDAFAEIKGDDATSRRARAEGRLSVGLMRSNLGEFKDAEQDYNQALHFYQQLAADFPTQPDFHQELGRSHNRRGVLLRRTGRLPEAEREFDQALGIQKQLVADFPTRPEFRKELATSHNNRGNVLQATSRLPEAEKDFDQALAIQQQLATDFPARPEFRRDLALSHFNRGNLLRRTGRPKDAEKEYNSAVSLYRQLVADFPAQPEFRMELASSHSGRGSLLNHTGRVKEAAKDYDQALSLRRRLAADFPARPEFRQNLARSLNSRAALLGDAGQLAAAEQDHEQALTLLRQLTANFPDQPDLRRDVAGTCLDFALLQERQGNWAGAKRLLLEGRPHHLAALKANPRDADYRQFYIDYLGALAKAHAGLLEQEDAVRTAQIRRDLGWDAPADAYDAACSLSLCVPIVVQHAKLDTRQRQEAARFYGDAAVKLLHEAVSKGYKNAAHMKKDTDLDPLRAREDFKQLVAALERIEQTEKAKP